MFRSPMWLGFGILTTAAVAALAFWAQSRKDAFAAALGDIKTLARIMENDDARRRAARWLRIGTIAFLFAALAGPQWGVDLVETRAAARQIVVAVDVSLSMQTPDVKPTRLERAKSSLSLLIDQLAGERIAVVAFAGDAQIICPLTGDLDAAKQLLSALEVGAIPVPGTAIGSAIRLSSALLGRYPGSKSVVLLTDGEDHHSDPVGAAKEAAAAGVKLYAIGIGTTEGEPIPIEGGGYKKDAHGSTVVSKLGESTLAQAAQATGGAYYRSSPGEDEISDIVSKIKAGSTASGLIGATTRWRNHYIWPLSAAFFLALLELLLTLAPFKSTAKAFTALLLIGFASSARAESFESRLRSGNAAYADGRYEDALEQFGAASAMKPSDPRPAFNAGDALYRLDRDSDAATAFSAAAAGQVSNRPAAAESFYNLGDARYRNGDYAGAADAYRRSLALAPQDADARRNLILAMRSQKNPPKKQPNKNNQQKDPPKNKDDQKNNSGGGDSQQHQDRSRPQDSMSREDAERLMRAVAEKEKAAQKQAPKQQMGMRGKPPPSPTGEDW